MGILDLFFPITCLECKKGNRYICSNCLKNVRLGISNNENFSLFKYEGVIRKAIIALKYKYSLEVAKEIADICIKKIPKNYFSKTTILVSIPMHWYRKNFRGFNQSEAVGSIIAQKMGLGLIPDLLIKTKSTKAQAELRGIDRRKNLQNSFKINEKYKAPNSVLLFDDVYTTGSTIKEAREVLKKSGVEKIRSLTIAR